MSGFLALIYCSRHRPVRLAVTPAGMAVIKAGEVGTRRAHLPRLQRTQAFFNDMHTLQKQNTCQ
jgi:hypothetical protein